MKKIGLDWGTVASSICFFNEEKNAFDFLRFGVNSQNFFPSVIAYKTIGQEEKRLIGHAAKKRMYLPGIDAYAGFKLSLGEGAKNKEGRYKSLYEAARDFIGTAIGEYVHAYHEVPEHIVFTVPDNWKSIQQKHPAIYMLELIFRDMGFDAETQVTFESESVSAAAYYCYEICKETYEGHLLVMDFGGGTLETTLTCIEEKGRIKVLKNFSVDVEEGKGYAGEAFDIGMTQCLSDKNHLGLKPGSFQFVQFKDAFEEAKIESSAQTARLLKAYYAMPAEGQEQAAKEEAFTVLLPSYKEYPVYVSDIINVFEQTFGGVIERQLLKVLEYCQNNGIDIEDGRCFRVMLTGGFSNLYCVEAKVRQMFRSNIRELDERFDEKMSRESKFTAIAHGAAIIAENRMSVEDLCQRDIGFYYYDTFNEEEKLATLIMRGELLRECREPRYFSGRLLSGSLGKGARIQVFSDNGEEGGILRTDLPVSDICPYTEAADNWYKLGISLGLHNTPLLHSLDSQGVHSVVPLMF